MKVLHFLTEPSPFYKACLMQTLMSVRWEVTLVTKRPYATILKDHICVDVVLVTLEMGLTAQVSE